MYILASKSPRRKQLMGEEISPVFKVITKDIDEESSYNMSPIDAVKDIARRKGLEVVKSHFDDVVISADTIVVLDNKIIGKPKDELDAYRILKSLSGRTHYVVTGYAIFNKGNVHVSYTKTDVVFNELTDELINKYIQSGSPLDKAGAYGVQDNEAYPLVNKVIGSKNNVIGFPTEDIKKDLIELGLL